MAQPGGFNGPMPPNNGQPFNITPYLNYPGGTPPPGVRANFDHPVRDNATPIAVGAVLCAVMLFFLGCRWYSKFIIVRKPYWDDLAICIGAIGTLMAYAAAVYSLTAGSMGYHQWDLRVKDLASDATFIAGFVFFIGGALASTFIRMACLIMYWHIFSQLRWMRIVLLTVGIIYTAANLAINIATTVLYVPKHGQSWLQHQIDDGAANLKLVNQIPIATVGLIGDVLVLVIPLPAVWGLQLPLRRRIGVMTVFLAGILASVASALNLYYRVSMESSTDLTMDFPKVYTVSVVEYALGVICASTPAAYHVLRYLDPFRETRTKLSTRFASATGRSKSGSAAASGLLNTRGASRMSTRHGAAEKSERPSTEQHVSGKIAATTTTTVVSSSAADGDGQSANSNMVGDSEKSADYPTDVTSRSTASVNR